MEKIMNYDFENENIKNDGNVFDAEDTKNLGKKEGVNNGSVFGDNGVEHTENTLEIDGIDVGDMPLDMRGKIVEKDGKIYSDLMRPDENEIEFMHRMACTPSEDLDDDLEEDEELDENDSDYDWEHINFLKELKAKLDETDERLDREMAERRKNGGLLNSQLVNYDDYEYEDFSEDSHLSDEEIQRLCDDESDYDWDAIDEYWKTHKRGAPHILIDPVTRKEIGTIYDTSVEEEEEEEEVMEIAGMKKLDGETNFKYLLRTLKYDDEFRKELEGVENSINFPYLDTNCFITWGNGYNLTPGIKPLEYDEKLELRNLKKNRPYSDESMTRRATDAEIEEAHKELCKIRNEWVQKYKKAKKKGENPSKICNELHTNFDKKINLRYSEEDVHKEYGKRVDSALYNIRDSIKVYNNNIVNSKKYNMYQGKEYKRLDDFENMNIKVFLALMDIAYNSGVGGWKNLFNAIARKDYKEAAKESHRDDKDGRDKNTALRNKITRDKFLDLIKN